MEREKLHNTELGSARGATNKIQEEIYTGILNLGWSKTNLDLIKTIKAVDNSPQTLVTEA